MALFSMKDHLKIYSLLIFLLCLAKLTSSKYTIFSSPVQLTFDQYSAIKQVKLRFMPETCFHTSDFMMISFSEPLEDLVTVPLAFSLLNEFTKELATGSFVFTGDAVIDSTYGMKMFMSGSASSYISDLSKAVWFITSNQIKSEWLTLVLKIPKNVVNQFQFSLGSVNMAIVSSLTPQSLKYQYSNALSYFYFATLIPSPPPQNIIVSIANNNYGKSGQTGQSYTPGALYPIYLLLEPSIDFKNFQLNLEFTSLNIAQVLAAATETKLLDFQFQGTCYFICRSDITCITALSCNVKPDKIEVNIAQLTLGQKYVLRFTVLNPPYQATKNLLIWSDAVGSIYDTVNVVNSVSTTPISITIQPDDLKLLWKIPASVVQTNMGLGFFIDGGINTVEVGFQITAGSPFGQVLEVTIDTGSYQIIIQSIQHNLPCINTTILYEFSQPLLTIKNVTALTKTGFRYWVAFRARYATSDTTRLASIGTTNIKLTRYPTKLLFNQGLANTPRLFKTWTDFRDTSGFHNPSLFKNSDSQVLSAADNGLQNGTSEAMRKYIEEPTTVGVDASIPNQQLLLLMKVAPAQFSGTTLGLNDKFHTRIYYNPNIIPTTSTFGLEVVAYNRGANHPLDSKWQTKGNKCYKDQSTDPTFQKFICQKYRDHVDLTQKDNLLVFQNAFPQIPYYSFACGFGVSIMCNKTSGNCQDECTLFRGYDPALGTFSGGVAAMRNLTFISGYQSPVQAGNDNLDFIIAFYHNDVLISASLINAYTLRYQNLQQTTVQLISTYKTLAKSNPGDRVPTLIKIQGRLALSEYISLQYPDKMKLFLPTTSIGLNDFLVNKNQMGCSYYCKLNASLTTVISQNWLEMHSIVIEKMPTLTNDFKILLPVQLMGNLQSIYVGFETRGKLVAVYRFGGSAVKSSINGVLGNIFTVQSRTPEWDLTSDWSLAPYTVADYKQCINLQQTNTQDTFTIISMALSNMPNRANPYVTVTIRNLQVLADYSSITVGNSLRNRTCDKFTYYYTSPLTPLITTKLQTFICQMYGNDNTTNNNIKIDYPLFSNMLGPGFPYDQVFTYAYTSDVDGSLEAVRRETAEKLQINLCRTNKATEYNVDQLGRQLEIFRIQVDPILLSISTFEKLQVIMTLPPNIDAVECTAMEAIFNQKLKCSVVLPLAAQTTLLLQLIDTTPIKLLDFYIYLNCKQIPGTVTLVPNTKYQVEVRLPHTTAVGNQQVIYGKLFSNFISTAYKCQNTFTYINAAYNKTILIIKHQLNSIAINLNTELQFTLVFSKQKSTLLENSHILFEFQGLEATEETLCYLREFEHVFWKREWTASTYKLITNKDIPALTDNPVTVKCSNLLLTSPNTTSPTLAVKVFDITGNIEIMTSLDGVPPYPLTTKPYYLETPVSSTAGSITAKQYTTLGFNGQYTLKYQLSGTGLVEGFIDLSEYWFDDRIVGCKLSIAQDVFCKPYNLNTNSTLEYRSRFIYFKTYYLTAFTQVSITIYPVLQQKQVSAPSIHTIMKLGGLLYYLPIPDTLPLTPVDDIFFINNYNIIPTSNLTSVMFNLDITLQFKAAVSQPLFVQLNQILFYNSIVGVVLKCSIDGISIPCSLVQKDLLKLGTFAYTAGMAYLLRIESFEPNYQIALRDKENFFIRLFVISPTKQIDYVSYLNTDITRATTLMTLIKSYQASVNKPSLIWNLTTSMGSTYLPKIYIGYYGPPIDLIVYDSSKFVTEFTLSSLSYNSTQFKCDMGLRVCQLILIADSFNSVIKQFKFSHSSTYYMQPPLIQVEVSNQKCIITTEFNNYKIFQNGMTLPIVLNFTHCRPRSMVKIVPNFSSSDIRIDDSLSQLEVTFDNPIGIIFVKHSSTVLTLVNYTVNFTLTGQYATSFQMPQGNIIIQKIARTESSIQAKLPEILTLAQNQTTLRIQCNEPSTVYWAIGFYPTTLGQEGQDIQTRLLNASIGLMTSVVDPLTYGNLEYGLTYTDTPNVWKTLNIKNLQGNSVYTFKYFCVNIKGSFSDGQILTFTTPQSTYQLVKLQLGFPSPLTFTMVNDFACAISQSLTLPYNDTKSSVNTNCKNAPLIFYDSHQDIIRDYNTSGDKPYFYNNFYIRSTIEPSQKIVSIIREKLKNNSRILKTQIPLWEIFNIEQIQPDVMTPGFEGQVEIQLSQTDISMTFPIRNQQFYVVIGLLSSFFNATSMSLPQTYMIKSGKFSQNIDFDKVFMNYTTGPITFNFEGLTADTQYSIFYFVTIDNPVINAKHSEVKYLNVVTKPYLTIDLFGENLVNSVYVWFGAFLMVLFLS